MNNSECIIQIKYINSTLFYRLRHKQHELLLAYTETEHNISNTKLETCKPNHPAPDNFYRLIPTAQNSEVK